jgi:hypothetical protein
MEGRGIPMSNMPVVDVGASDRLGIPTFSWLPFLSDRFKY